MVEIDLRKACEETIARLFPIPLQSRWELKRSHDTEPTYRLLRHPTHSEYRSLRPEMDLQICVQLRNRFRPSELPMLLERFATDCEHRMLFTDYVTSVAAKHLRDCDIWYADAQGNAFMHVPDSVLIQSTGHRPQQMLTPIGQHFSAPGAKILHYLLKRGPRIQATYRDIREVIGVSIDKIGKLIRELEQCGSLRMHGSGDYEILNGDRLLSLWAEAYEAKLKPALLLGRYTAANPDFGFLIQEATDVLDGQVVVGGDVAADALTEHLRPELLHLYVPEDRTVDVRRGLKLALSESGTVKLCNLYSPDIASERRIDDSAPVADATFVYAELMADGDDRLAETAMRLRQEQLQWTL